VKIALDFEVTVASKQKKSLNGKLEEIEASSL
jgi:hypothetical protein